MEEPRTSKRTRPLYSKVGNRKASRNLTTGLQNQVIVNFPGPQDRYSADSKNKSKKCNTKKNINKTPPIQKNYGVKWKLNRYEPLFRGFSQAHAQ
ncbi:hypothetical protein AYI68_g7013 [Smittium mucronatum]|uniref:Uncharacterized protein n=1 Tax=Smittium mucronatum TaxID=133383 RepID=A0A1R0GPZ6_9FUNG|nr:hypothetical protein AYI68_g7013 [Smittium mucronatum]